MNLDIILAALARLHAASDKLCALPTNSDWNEEYPYQVAFTTAADDLWDMAPSWFTDVAKEHGLYGTDLAGDPSSWAIDEVAELCAMLAISKL